MNMSNEVICDYIVSEKCKKIWSVEIDLFLQIMNLCEKHGLTVWALAGTMLGAVRHKGFIPWDDDMDIALPRDDFEKLKSIAKTELKWPYYLQTPETDPMYYSSTIRIRNINTTGIILEYWDMSDKENSNQGIYIDIFPLDYWPEYSIQQNILVNKAFIYNKLLLTYKRSTPETSKKSIINTLINSYVNAIGYDKLLKRSIDNCTKYKGRSKTYAMVARGKVKNIGFRYIWTKEETANTEYLQFENIKIPVPCGYDSCLKKRYGDYMSLPSVEERGKWHNNKIFFDPDKPYTSYAKYSREELIKINVPLGHPIVK